MNDQLDILAQRYSANLRQYLTGGQEAVLEQAYELGRRAIAEGLGVLDMAQLHQQALEQLLHSPAGTKTGGGDLKMVETFFLESLSPFETTHRGFRELNDRLQERNRKLEAEVSERKRAESALRQSEKHYLQLFNEARTMQENLRRLSNKILHTQEEERKRISRELHDEVGQSLTAINVLLATLKHNGDREVNASNQKLAEAQSLLRETMETVHGFARDLRPAMLDELGLLPALRSYLKAFAKRTGIQVLFRGNRIAEKLGNDQKTVVFRITQECLTNVSKHARASQLEVVVCKLKEGICMEITDNGRSFRADRINSARSKGRLGLLGMEERVRLVKGQFTVKPRPGKGTTVRVVIPFNPAAAAMSPKRTRNRRKDKPIPAEPGLNLGK